MQYRIVADSSSNVLAFSGIPYTCVPMKVITTEKEYVDAPELDVEAMVDEIEHTPGKSGSSCPNVQEWKDAFSDAEGVFAVTITSNLSGACGAAQAAGQQYEKKHPGRKVCVLDSLSTGPEMELIIEKLRELITSGTRTFEQIENEIREYMKHTHLTFMLKSLSNLAKNGRVNPVVAKAASVLHICMVGRASDEGTLEPLHKCRGEKRALATILEEMKGRLFAGGKVRITHCMNEAGAQQLRQLILSAFPHADVKISLNRGLCSFYAERGGLLVGFEG